VATLAIAIRDTAMRATDKIMDSVRMDTVNKDLALANMVNKVTVVKVMDSAKMATVSKDSKAKAKDTVNKVMEVTIKAMDSVKMVTASKDSELRVKVTTTVRDSVDTVVTVREDSETKVMVNMDREVTVRKDSETRVMVNMDREVTDMVAEITDIMEVIPVATRNMATKVDG